MFVVTERVGEAGRCAKMLSLLSEKGDAMNLSSRSVLARFTSHRDELPTIYAY
jgi:hypothetical protein